MTLAPRRWLNIASRRCGCCGCRSGRPPLLGVAAIPRLAQVVGRHPFRGLAVGRYADPLLLFGVNFDSGTVLCRADYLAVRRRADVERLRADVECFGLRDRRGGQGGEADIHAKAFGVGIFETYRNTTSLKLGSNPAVFVYRCSTATAEAADDALDVAHIALTRDLA